MGESMTVDQVREILFRACEKAGSQRQWAMRYGLSNAYVNDVLSSRRDPGEGILVALGLRKIVTYERVPQEIAAPVYNPWIPPGRDPNRPEDLP